MQRRSTIFLQVVIVALGIMVTTFVSIVIATVAAVFERILQNAVEMKSENDLTV